LHFALARFVLHVIHGAHEIARFIVVRDWRGRRGTRATISVTRAWARRMSAASPRKKNIISPPREPRPMTKDDPFDGQALVVFVVIEQRLPAATVAGDGIGR
jgi:hypothetical protein